MNKKEFIAAMAAKSELSQVDAAKALDAFLDITVDEMKKGNKLTFVGFGTFEVVERAARNGRNPQTGKPMTIEAHKVVKFRPGSRMK